MGFILFPHSWEKYYGHAMTNALQTIVKTRLEELQIGPIEAATKAGLERTFIRDIVEGRKKAVRHDKIAVLAAAIRVDAAALGRNELVRLSPDDLAPAPIAGSDATVATSAPALPPRQSMPLDIPVMGTAAGSLSRGAFQFEGGVVDYVRRPPALVGARDIYALFVEGSSMEPQFFPGDLIYVNPHRPPRIGDIVVVQCSNGEHAPNEASLGIYRRRSEKAVVIGKRNPVAEIELMRDHVTAIHRVLTMNELFGV
ncbi:LexA family transcriptional regulator [Ciceribacter ferrooxidans]|uniref:LexA family transcriptional regulator n=1 Tax=Ciceribacter ferrooxidans TaxID=2509717 RepID=A0A4Q2SZM1_9HYPH|nr:LexA family transcriptional regulator [Ciceribacter ferrooxidans]